LLPDSQSQLIPNQIILTVQASTLHIPSNKTLGLLHVSPFSFLNLHHQHHHHCFTQSASASCNVYKTTFTTTTEPPQKWQQNNLYKTENTTSGPPTTKPNITLQHAYNAAAITNDITGSVSREIKSWIMVNRCPSVSC